MSFIAALQLTSVADVLIIQATAPFVAAFLGRVWLKEPVDMAVLVASGIAFLGVAIMVVGSIGRGSIDGDLFAMLMTLGFALMIVMMRRWRHVSMMPAVLVGTMLAVLASAPLARPLDPSWQDFVWLALFGLSQMGLGWILLTTGAPKIPAGEAALLGVLEVVPRPDLGLAGVQRSSQWRDPARRRTCPGRGPRPRRAGSAPWPSVLPCRDLTLRRRSPHRPGFNASRT